MTRLQVAVGRLLKDMDSCDLPHQFLSLFAPEFDEEVGIVSVAWAVDLAV